MSNYAEMMDALRIYREAMRRFIVQSLEARYKDLWWPQGVARHFKPEELGRLEDILRKRQKAALVQPEVREMADMLDIAHFRQIITANWKPVFEQRLGDKAIVDSWIAEVTAARNALAHWSSGDVDRQAALTFVHTCQRVVQAFDEEAAAQIREIWNRIDRSPDLALQSRPTQAHLPTVPVRERPASALKPWRDVIVPHEDVRRGRYQQAEFAADLAQVLAGTAEAEYQDPREFFRRTFITPDMRHLLRSALERLAGRGADPVVDLKTAFGGGKTHTLLALYHLVTSGDRVADLPDVKAVLEEADVGTPTGRCAVIVGTDLNPAEPRVVLDVGGQVNTLWGLIAYQLGGYDAFRIVQEADARGVAPGADALADVFRMVGPCVVLIDELVAFMRNINGKKGLPSGDYNSHITFLQSLTEAVKRVPTAMLVVSIPESRIEYGDERGEKIAQRVEHIIGRLSRPWQPVGAREAFEVVRRRLFQDIQDPAARDQTCEAFGKLYRSNPNDFPAECREAAYVQRMKESYPIHPEVFDLLYERWSTLERFQRTRGVLRLMATVIHRLWEDNDRSPMITPGSLPLYDPRVRDELTRYLGEQWNSVVDHDVDGQHSEPWQIERENPRFDQIQAARRITRTVFLGATPGEVAANPATRGVDDVRINLGVVQPDEPVAVYGDALNRLQQRLSHLYTSGQGRFWFGVQPNLNKTVADRISRVTDDEAFEEMERRLREMARRDRAEFAGVHACPEHPSDVADEPRVRLVILSPRTPHAKDASGPDTAVDAAQRILDDRGTGPRWYRNMLVFAAADEAAVDTLKAETRRYLAWDSIVKDAEELNLDKVQQARARESRDKADGAVTAQLHAAYQWVLVPEQDGTEPIRWEALILRSGTLEFMGGIAQRASHKLQTDELFILRWAPIHLQRELDRWFWKDDRTHIGIKQLWDHFARYPYLPRLRDHDVLLEAIRVGVRSEDFFGYAQGVGDDGRYFGLVFGAPAAGIYFDDAGVVVRRDVAAAQVAAAKPETPRPAEAPAASGPAGVPGVEAPAAPARPRPKRFYGRIKLSALRVAAEAGKVADEVIAHLEGLPDSQVEVVLEIHATSREGVPDHVERTVAENARTLKFEDFGFETE